MNEVEEFSLNSESALFMLKTALDREVKDRYVLRLQVIDSSTTPVRTGSIVVLVNSILFEFFIIIIMNFCAYLWIFGFGKFQVSNKW